MSKILLILGLLFSITSNAQELYVFSEPASNMPAHSVSTKLLANFVGPQSWKNRSMQRYSPEVMFGISKKIMVHTATTFSNMHTNTFKWESVYIYAKYRFLSFDEVHKHFRMAAFGEATYSRAPFHNDEVSINGDKSGVQAGLIATQLWHKFAISGTLSHTEVLHASRKSNVIYVPERNYQSLNYSLSAGYLLLPKNYTSYKQLNVNLYTELLGQKINSSNQFYVDLAPAVQFIFNSNFKINLGYRYQLNGNMERMADKSFLISMERTFLNALKKRA
jgi:hypothetical protein